MDKVQLNDNYVFDKDNYKLSARKSVCARDMLAKISYELDKLSVFYMKNWDDVEECPDEYRKWDKEVSKLESRQSELKTMLDNLDRNYENV